MSKDIRIMAGAFIAMGIAHFARPEPFEKIVPRVLPYRRELVLGSGAAEIAVGAMMLNPRTRRHGGRAAAGLLLAVFTANIQMAADAVNSPKAPSWYKAAVLARLGFQFPMIRIALKAARS